MKRRYIVLIDHPMNSGPRYIVDVARPDSRFTYATKKEAEAAIAEMHRRDGEPWEVA